MRRLAFTAMVVSAVTLSAPELAAGEPQRVRPRRQDGGEAAGAPRPGPRAAPPARRTPPPRAAEPARARPARPAAPRAAPGGPPRAPRVSPAPRRPDRGASARRPERIGERGRGRPGARVGPGAAPRAPGGVNVRRPAPRRARPEIEPHGAGGRPGRYGRGRAVPRYEDGAHRRNARAHRRGHRVVRRHVHRPRFFYPAVYGSYFHFPGYALDLRFGRPHYHHYGRPGYGYWPYDRWYDADHYDPYVGFLRLKVKPRWAEVYVNGYYVGVVNHFDGVFQRLRLPEGPHRIEIRHPDHQPIEIEVLIVAGAKVTYEARLQPH